MASRKDGTVSATDGRRSPYNIKSLCTDLIPLAIEDATEGGAYAFVSRRDVFYRVRDRYMEHPQRPYHMEFLLKRRKNADGSRETDDEYNARREQDADRPWGRRYGRCWRVAGDAKRGYYSGSVGTTRRERERGQESESGGGKIAEVLGR